MPAHRALRTEADGGLSTGHTDSLDFDPLTPPHHLHTGSDRAGRMVLGAARKRDLLMRTQADSRALLGTVH